MFASENEDDNCSCIDGRTRRCVLKARLMCANGLFARCVNGSVCRCFIKWLWGLLCSDFRQVRRRDLLAGVMMDVSGGSPKLPFLNE